MLTAGLSLALSLLGDDKPAKHPAWEPAELGAAAPAALKPSPKAVLKGSVGSIDVRYPRAGTPQGEDRSVKLVAWRGERASAQLLLWATEDLDLVRVEGGSLRSGAAAIPVQASFVRYVRAEGQLVPDILDVAREVELPAGTRRPVWLTVDIPRDAEPGPYRGQVVAQGGHGSKVVFPLELEVLAATLPAPRDWRIHLDLWQQPESVARYHDVPLWSPEHFALLKPLMQRLAEAGQKTITCSLFHEPWGGQTYDRIPGMVAWRRKADGTWAYDYDVFDRWVAFMSDEVGLSKAFIHCYTMIPWSLSFRYFDEATGSVQDAKLKPGTPEYEAFWGPFLADFTRHLKAKGWLERTRIAMDERPDAILRPALATLRKHAPEIKAVAAINGPSAITEEMEDVSAYVTHTGGFTPELLDRRRKAGRTTTFYVCCDPKQPNTFTASAPAEAQWQGLFAAARGFDGFLRWAWNSWVADPLACTDHVSWTSGDCFLVYPGNRSSIRFERLRDGLEDFEKVRLLREAASGVRTPEASAAMAGVEKALEAFTWERGKQEGVHAADVAQAQAALERAARVLLK